MSEAVVKYELPSPTIAVDAQQMLEIISSVEIEDEQTRSFVSDQLADVKAKTKELSDKRMSITRPLDAAKKAVMDLFNPALAFLDRAEAECKNRLMKYDNKVKAALAAEQKRLADIAIAERSRIALEARQREMEAAKAAQDGDADSAISAMAAAQVARAQAGAVMPVFIPKAQKRAESTRKEWKVDTIDLKTLVAAAAARDELMAYLQADEKAIGAVVRALKEMTSIPGVTVKEVETMSARRSAG
jgi:hypothetical protein